MRKYIWKEEEEEHWEKGNIHQNKYEEYVKCLLGCYCRISIGRSSSALLFISPYSSRIYFLYSSKNSMNFAQGNIN